MTDVIEPHYLSASVEILFDRIQWQAIEYPPIERQQLLRWAAVFQPPTPEEMALFDTVYA